MNSTWAPATSSITFDSTQGRTGHKAVDGTGIDQEQPFPGTIGRGGVANGYRYVGETHITILTEVPVAANTVGIRVHDLGKVGGVVGLPEHAIPLALAFFNIGVEAGQLTGS